MSIASPVGSPDHRVAADWHGLGRHRRTARCHRSRWTLRAGRSTAIGRHYGQDVTSPQYPRIVEPSYEETAILGLLVIKPKYVEDERGIVREFFRLSEWQASGLPQLEAWTQVNLTFTKYGAVRAFHAEAMTKLIGVAAGEAFGAYVDLRSDSPTIGSIVTTSLPVGTQVLVPEGVANGFQSVSSEGTQYVYCFDREWRAGMPGLAVTPLDESLGVDWPVPLDAGNRHQVSAKDAAAPTLHQVIRPTTRAKR